MTLSLSASRLCTWITGLLTCLLFSSPLVAQVSSPNVLLIITDDQGWGDVHSHGNSRLDTPVMDRLGNEGIRLERFFVSPVCAPTRAALLTGRYALRTGTHGVTRSRETMRTEEVTLAEVFRDAGYATGAFGKWHNGAHYPHDPNGQGFDEFLGFTAGHWNNYFDTHLMHNGVWVQREGYVNDVFTDAAISFIKQHADRPFFTYVPYNTPHSPFQLPDRYFDKYKARGFDDKNAAVYGMVENLDDNIGRLLGTLDTLDIAENTIVIFVGDNGPNGGDRYNGNMRGAKGSLHEGGVRVPFFIRWLGGLPSGHVVRQNAMHIDVLPTLLELTGITSSNTLPLDGRSLVPLLQGTDQPWTDRALFNHRSWGGTVTPRPGAVRTQRWRAVNMGEAWTLYDMYLDPGQQSDVAYQHPAVTDSLAGLFESWFDDVTETGFDPIPAPVGYAERPITILPGHEATLLPKNGAGISYKVASGWANDWITNWTDREAYPVWHINVVQEGRYAITLMYTATPEQVGTKLDVTLGTEQVTGTVTKAHDPPYTFSPDRVYRKEVFEKSWAPLELGMVTLPAGPTQVTIRTTTLPGGHAPDLKSVHLTRMDLN